MTNRVSVEREIFLNGERYPLGGDGRVRTIVTSQYPQKIVMGDVDKDSNPRTSLIVWEDWSGGVGVYSTDGKENLNRSHFSRADGRYKNHLTLPPLYTAGADSGGSGVTTAINEFGVKLYAAVSSGRDIRAYTVASNSWGSTLRNEWNASAGLETSVYESIAFTMGATDYLAYAYGTGYLYTSTPDVAGAGSWINDTTDVKSFAFWDDRLWGLDNTGQLWFSTVVGTEVNDAKIPLPDGYAHVLFTGPDAQGEDILYVSTEVGLWAHDAANARFVKTKVAFPRMAAADSNTVAVQGAATWNGDIYITAGKMTVYRYDPTRGVVMSVGLNKDAGFPISEIRGDIIKLLPTHTGLLAFVNGTGSTYRTIWEYNGVGWHYLSRDHGSAQGNHVSSIGGNYRLYHLVGDAHIGYTALQRGDVNPELASPAISYEGTNDIADHITPWFNAGQNEIDKTAIRVRIECAGMTADETVKVEYALNYSATYESASTSDGKSTFTAKDTSSNGVTAAVFPKIGTTATPPVANTTSQAGVDFRAIRFKLTLNRGSTTTRTPNVKSLSLEWRRKIPAKYGFEFTVDRSDSYGGKTPKEMKTDIITAIETGTQVEFTFVDDDGNTQNYYVDVTNMEDVEDTGHGEIGQTRIAVVEA